MEISFGRPVIKWDELNVAIIGLGLMGASYAKGLRHLGVRKIIGVEIDKEVLVEAQRLGIVDIPLAEPNEALRLADVVILAIYPEDMARFVKTALPYLKENALITDVAGVKNGIICEIQGLLPKGVEFVSGHPMAGRQAKGLGMSDAAIFHNANYIVVPHNNSMEAVAWLESMARSLGCRYTIRVTAEEHDKIIAYTSSLPHISAIALINSESFNDSTKYFIAGGFRDGTRVADINPDLWGNLFMANRENAADEVGRYIDQLKIWEKALREGDEATLKEQMRNAAARRRELY